MSVEYISKPAKVDHLQREYRETAFQTLEINNISIEDYMIVHISSQVVGVVGALSLYIYMYMSGPAGTITLTRSAARRGSAECNRRNHNGLLFLV